MLRALPQVVRSWDVNLQTIGAFLCLAIDSSYKYLVQRAP